MAPRRNLFGETSETEEEEILRMAQEAAARRAWVIYDDFSKERGAE